MSWTWLSNWEYTDTTSHSLGSPESLLSGVPSSSPQYSQVKISLASSCWIPKVTGFISSIIRRYNDRHKSYSSRILTRLVQASYWKGASPCGHWESPRSQNRVRFCFSWPHSSLSCTLDVEAWAVGHMLPSVLGEFSTFACPAFHQQHPVM